MWVAMPVPKEWPHTTIKEKICMREVAASHNGKEMHSDIYIGDDQPTPAHPHPVEAVSLEPSGVQIIQAHLHLLLTGPTLTIWLKKIEILQLCSIYHLHRGRFLRIYNKPPLSLSLCM
jgi:hypothetical protein